MTGITAMTQPNQIIDAINYVACMFFSAVFLGAIILAVILCVASRKP